MTCIIRWKVFILKNAQEDHANDLHQNVYVYNNEKISFNDKSS